MSENLEMLQHFIDVKHPNLDLWKRLVKFLTASSDAEAEKVFIPVEAIAILNFSSIFSKT